MNPGFRIKQRNGAVTRLKRLGPAFTSKEMLISMGELESWPVTFITVVLVFSQAGVAVANGENSRLLENYNLPAERDTWLQHLPLSPLIVCDDFYLTIMLSDETNIPASWLGFEHKLEPRIHFQTGADLCSALDQIRRRSRNIKKPNDSG